jgi:hypothetical protein
MLITAGLAVLIGYGVYAIGRPPIEGKSDAEVSTGIIFIMKEFWPSIIGTLVAAVPVAAIMPISSSPLGGTRTFSRRPHQFR